MFVSVCVCVCAVNCQQLNEILSGLSVIEIIEQQLLAFTFSLPAPFLLTPLTRTDFRHVLNRPLAVVEKA